MVVDDELGPRESLRILFKDIYDVHVVKSGPECLAELAEKKFALVILDLKMPDMGGIEVLEEIKRCRPETKVIILTGYGTPEAARRARELGVTAYLAKPFDIFDLRKLLARETGQAENGRP